MTKKGLRRLITLMLPVLLILTATLSSGCTESESGPQSPTETPNHQAVFVTPQEAFELIQMNKTNPNFVVIDDRKEPEFNAGHIAGAVNMPFASLADTLGKLNKNKIYLVYCPSGCGATSRLMDQSGFKDVHEIEGGFEAWTAEGLPVEIK